MNRKELLLSLFLTVIACPAIFGQADVQTVVTRESIIKSEIAKDISNLQAIRDDIVKMLKNPPQASEYEYFVHNRLTGAWKSSRRLQKNYAFSNTAATNEKPVAPMPPVTKEMILQTLAARISDVLTNPDMGSTAELDMKQAGNVARQLEALIDFSSPGNAIHGPLKFAAFYGGIEEIREAKDIGEFERVAIEMLKKNCDVDFIDDGTNYRALRMIGTGNALTAEIDKCRSAERNTIIVNRRAASPPEKLIAEEMEVMDGLIRTLFRWKDIASRKRLVEAGREFLRRWGSNEAVKALTDWLKTQIPKQEQLIKNGSWE